MFNIVRVIDNWGKARTIECDPFKNKQELLEDIKEWIPLLCEGSETIIKKLTHRFEDVSAIPDPLIPFKTNVNLFYLKIKIQ